MSAAIQGVIESFEQTANRAVAANGDLVGYYIDAGEWRRLRAVLQRVQSRIRPCARCGNRTVYAASSSDMTVCDDCAMDIGAEDAEAADPTP